MRNAGRHYRWNLQSYGRHGGSLSRDSAAGIARSRCHPLYVFDVLCDLSGRTRPVPRGRLAAEHLQAGLSAHCHEATQNPARQRRGMRQTQTKAAAVAGRVVGSRPSFFFLPSTWYSIPLHDSEKMPARALPLRTQRARQFSEACAPRLPTHSGGSAYSSLVADAKHISPSVTGTDCRWNVAASNPSGSVLPLSTSWLPNGASHTMSSLCVGCWIKPDGVVPNGV